VAAREVPARPKPVAKRIALTRPQKSLPSSYRRKKALRRSNKAAAKPSERSSKRADSCREPYYYDPGGIKRLKMECL
jgi:hypothetical protein